MKHQGFFSSGRRGSNSRHSAWKADALPTELLPHFDGAKVRHFFISTKQKWKKILSEKNNRLICFISQWKNRNFAPLLIEGQILTDCHLIAMTIKDAKPVISSINFNLWDIYLLPNQCLKDTLNKIADQISDALIDHFLAFDPSSKVACETLVTTGQVILAGEVKSKTYLDVQQIAPWCD